jgi:hypothetical protein
VAERGQDERVQSELRAYDFASAEGRRVNHRSGECPTEGDTMAEKVMPEKVWMITGASRGIGARIQ